MVGKVFGMSNTVVTPPNAAAAVPLREIFLLRIAGIAEMDVNVDGAGQNMQPARIQRLPGRRHRLRRTDRMDQAVLDRDAGVIAGVRRDDRAAIDDEIDRVGHDRASRYNIAQPPSTGRSTPVIWRETSLAKNRQALATSSSTVTRFIA